MDQKLTHNIGWNIFFSWLKMHDFKGYFAEGCFDTSEEKQLWYFQNGYFFKSLWSFYEPRNQVNCRLENKMHFLNFSLMKHNEIDCLFYIEMEYILHSKFESNSYQIEEKKSPDARSSTNFLNKVVSCLVLRHLWIGLFKFALIRSSW